MNALQRDLKKLVPLLESLGAEKAAADPHRQRFHIQPMVGWLNDGAAVLSTRYYPAPGPAALCLTGCCGTLYEITL